MTVIGPGLAAYRSFDGGQTWELAFEKTRPAPTGEFGDPGRSAHWDDPAVAYGPDGTIYYACLFVRSGVRPPQLHIQRSFDGGNAWEAAVHVSDNKQTGPIDGADRPFLAVDQSVGKFHGRVYCDCLLFLGKSRGPGITMSADAGRTFTPLRHLQAQNAWHMTSGQSAVLSDGTYIVSYQVRTGPPRAKRQLPGTFEIRVCSSASGGDSFSAERCVMADDDALAEGMGPYSIIPMMAADPGSARLKDRLYLVWSQKTAGSQRILVTRSEDKGTTWSKPTLLSEQPADKPYDAVLPAVAVNRTGIVGVCWYDSRESRGTEPRTHFRFRASLDGGETWLPSIRITDVPSPVALNESFSAHGDTSGLAADAAGDFHPAWVDKRTGTMQVFTAKVSVR
jgi:hypothetical protein